MICALTSLTSPQQKLITRMAKLALNSDSSSEEDEPYLYVGPEVDDDRFVDDITETLSKSDQRLLKVYELDLHRLEYVHKLRDARALIKVGHAAKR